MNLYIMLCLILRASFCSVSLYSQSFGRYFIFDDCSLVIVNLKMVTKIKNCKYFKNLKKVTVLTVLRQCG